MLQPFQIPKPLPSSSPAAWIRCWTKGRTGLCLEQGPQGHSTLAPRVYQHSNASQPINQEVWEIWQSSGKPRPSLPQEACKLEVSGQGREGGIEGSFPTLPPLQAASAFSLLSSGEAWQGLLPAPLSEGGNGLLSWGRGLGKVENGSEREN